MDESFRRIILVSDFIQLKRQSQRHSLRLIYRKMRQNCCYLALHIPSPDDSFYSHAQSTSSGFLMDFAKLWGMLPMSFAKQLCPSWPQYWTLLEMILTVKAWCPSRHYNKNGQTYVGGTSLIRSKHILNMVKMVNGMHVSLHPCRSCKNF